MSHEAAIASVANPRFKRWRRAAGGQVRKTGITLAAGARIVGELSLLMGEAGCWIVPEGFDQPLPGSSRRPIAVLARPLFKELDSFGTGYPLLELPVPEPEPLPEQLKAGLHVVIPSQDPRNVGAIIRTAAGLGATGIYLLESSAHPFHPMAVRTSSGAVFAGRIHPLAGLHELVERNCPVFSLDAAGEPISTVALPPRAALLVGLEGPGIDTLLDRVEPSRRRRVSLPMTTIESYNAAVAASLAMYEWRRQNPFAEEA